MRRAFLLTVLVLLALGGHSVASADEPLRLTIGVADPIGPLDPATGSTSTAREVWRLQYPTLTAVSTSTLRTTPGLASAWTMGDDARTWEYTLRDTSWSDGVPVTAEDVVSSLERAQGEEWPYARDAFDGFTATAVDEHTVRITAPEPGGLPALPLHVVPKHVFDAGTDVDNGDMVSGGDWRVVDRSETEVRLAAVDRPGRPALDEIVFRSYADGETLIDALQAGDVDVAAALPISTYLNVRELPDITAVHANDGDQWILRSRVDDPAVRAAIARAIDRDRLVRETVAGAGRAQRTPIVELDSAMSPDDARAQNPEFAPGAARRRVQQLPEPPDPITLSEPSDSTGSVVASSLEAMLEDAGLEVERVASGGDLELLRRDPGEDPLPAFTPYTCAGDVWCDAAFDDAYQRYESASDAVTRDDAVETMLSRLVTENREIVLFAPDQVQAFRTDHVTGLLREPSEGRLVTFWPGTDQYREVVAAQPPAGEELPTSTFVAIAIAVLVGFGAFLWFAVRLGRSRTSVDGDVEVTVDGEGLPRERSPT